MASQFDSLLDFGDPTPVDSGTVTKSSNDFDPFGGSPSIEVKGSAGGDLLADFAFDSQISNGNHNGTEFSVKPSDSFNPLYELANSTSLDSNGPTNPLYNMSETTEVSPVSQKSEIKTPESANPLYDFVSVEETNGKPEATNGADSLDLMGTSTTVTSDDSGVTMETVQTSEDDLIMVSDENEIMVEREKGNENGVEINGEFNTEDNNIVNQGEISQTEQTGMDKVYGDQDSEELISVQNQEEEQIPVVTEDVISEEIDQGAEVAECDQKPADSQQDLVLQGDSISTEDQAPDDEQSGPEEVQHSDTMGVIEEQEPIGDQVRIEQDIEPVYSEQVIDVEASQTETQQEPEMEFEQEEVTQDDKISSKAVEDQDTTSFQEEDKVQEPQNIEPVQQEVLEQTETEMTQDTEVSEMEVADKTEEPDTQDSREDVAEQEEHVEAKVEDAQEEMVKHEPAEEEVATSDVQEDECLPEEEGPPGYDEDISRDEEATQEEVVTKKESGDKEIITTKKEETKEVITKKEEPKAAPVETKKVETKKVEQTVTKTPEPKGQEKVVTETKTVSQSSVVQNGIDEEEPPRDPNVFRETTEKEEIHFDEMSNIKNKFESGGSEFTPSKRVNVQDEILGVEAGEFENEPTKFEQWQTTTEGGVYESQPVENPDVFKESMKNIGEELPEVGMAKNVLHKFQQIQEDSQHYTPSKSGKRELTPDRTGKSEYVSEPRNVIEQPTQVLQAGVFESNPAEPVDVVRSTDHLEDQLPESGYAKNVLAKFKQYESEAGNRPPPSPGQREITPDRFTKGEYVSEPRNTFEPYQAPVEAGTYESQPQDVGDVVKSGVTAEEVLPEKGTALSLVSKFKQYEQDVISPPSPSTKRELTPDRSGKVEYVSEPRGHVEHYEGQSESGVFESKPEDVGEVVKSGEHMEEQLPEAGYTKNVASKFKELEKTGGSPSSTPRRMKEFTPPKEDDRKGTRAGVLESTPEDRPDVVKSYDVVDAELPEKGTARNILNKFKEIQTQSPQAPHAKKEFTPPPDKGVFENQPAPSLQLEVREAESGILESTPQKIEGVAREDQQSEGNTVFPESGYAKNMVNRWKQLESESGKTTPSPKKHKEFTPPRDSRGPLSPKSPAGTGSSVQPSDLPGQYQEQGSAGVYENTPERKEGVYREADTDFEEGLPAKDTTKSLLQRFKSIQEEAKEAEKTPQPISRKDSTPKRHSPTPEKQKMFEDDDDSSKKSSFVPVQLEKCAACQKTVYALEKVEINSNAYHKACFRCSQCKSTLTPKSFSINEGTIYCTTHFKQLFKLKGNYDEGFGRHQYKKRWAEEQARHNSQSENGDVQH